MTTNVDTKLSADRVSRTFRECLFTEEEAAAPGAKATAVVGDGVMHKIGFHPARLAAADTAIAEMLGELPSEFMAAAGGGWSFLNACNDRHGDLWTGKHATIDLLLSLGLASGRCQYVMPREMWSILPGGMPYFVVVDPAPAAPAEAA